MSNTYKLDYKRSVLRGVSDLISTTSMLAMKMQAYQRMTESDWLEVAEPISSLPVHWWNHSGFSDSYDAATFCGDYSEGKQKSYACASCYTIKIPRDAQTGIPAKIEAVLATVRGDRWLSDGAVVSAFISNSETPPSWHTIIDTDNPSYLLSSPDPAPAIDDVTTPDWQAPLRGVNRSNAADESAYAATITADTPVDAGRYLHVIIRMSDYLSVYKITLEGGVIKDNAWVEGGANIDGTTLMVQFNRAVSSVSSVNLFKKGIGPSSYDFEYSVLIKMTPAVYPDLTAAELYSFLMEQVKYYPREFVNLYEGGNCRDAPATGEWRKVGFITDSPTSTKFGIQYMICARTGVSVGGRLSAISLENSIPLDTDGVPAGQTFRISAYLAYPQYISDTRIPDDVVQSSLVSTSLWDGNATSIQLYDKDQLNPTPPETLNLIPLVSIPITTAIAAETRIPVQNKVSVAPGLVMLVVCLSVDSLEDGYNADTTVDHAAKWNPAGSFNLILEDS